MKKLTFCVFSANDTPEEQDKISICLNSLLSQDTDESCVIFCDCSKQDKRFQVPNSPDLKVIYRPTDTKDWNRSVIRNEMVIQAETEIICQICADCAYSPAFARKVIQAVGTGDRLVMCCRRSSSKKQWSEIRSKKLVTPEMAHSIELHSPSACGECQAMNRKQFIGIGGYHQLIVNGKSTIGNFGQTAGKDDTNLRNYVYRERQFTELKHNIVPVWIHDDPEVWIVHLYHDERANAAYWRDHR